MVAETLYNSIQDVRLASDGGIAVDYEMRSSCEHVYAAGDACTVDWKDTAFQWFQVTTFIEPYRKLFMCHNSTS